MKTTKILIALTLVLGVLTLSNCKKNEAEINPSNQTKLTINTSSVGFDADTKTLMDGVTPKWVTGDKIGVITNENTANDAFSSTLSDSYTKASFTGTTTLENGANTIYAYYPYSTLNGTSNTKTSTKLALPTYQSPSLTSFDGAADIMVGKPYSYTYSGSGSADISDFQFMRLMSVVKVVFKNSGTDISSEKVEKVTLIAGEALKVGDAAASAGNQVLSGGVELNLTDGSFSFYDAVGGNYRRNYVVASYLGSANYIIDAAGTKCTYLMINPVTIASGGKLTFEVVTSGHKITKTVTLPSEISFTGGKIHTLNVSIDDTHISVFKHYSLPYEMKTTNNNAATDWTSADWVLGNSQTSGTFWGVRLGGSSTIGSATSPPLSGFTEYVKVTFNAVGWSGETPKIYVSLLDENDVELKSNFRTIAQCTTASSTPTVAKDVIMAPEATYSVVLSGASEAKKVKIVPKDGPTRFFLAYVKVETATAGDIQVPVANTLDATDIQGQSAKLNLSITTNDASLGDITEVGFYWKKTSDSDYTKATLSQATDTDHTLSGLSYGTGYSYYAYLKVGSTEYDGTVKTFTTTGPAISINPGVLTLALAANSTAILTITSLAGQNWSATTTGSGFTLSANTGTIGAGGTSTITITALNDNTAESSVNLGTVTVKLDDYTSSTATATIKQAGTKKHYERVTSNDQIVSGGSYLIVENVNGYVMGNSLSSYKFSPIDCSSKYDSVNDQFTSDANTTDKYAVTFTTASSGYTLKFTISGNYIIYNSSTNFAALNTTIPADNKGWWTVAEDETTDLYKINCVGATTRSIIYQAGSVNKFGPYLSSTGDYSFVRLYILQ